MRVFGYGMIPSRLTSRLQGVSLCVIALHCSVGGWAAIVL